MSRRFTISILAYGGLEYTKKCIKSVLDNSKEEDWELILTDNASNDGTLEFFEVIQEAYPDRVQIVHNDTNLGFIDPNRIALKMARGEFFVMLNNDAEVPGNWLRMLAEPFDKWETCAITGCQGGCTQLSDKMTGEPGGRLEYIEGSCLCAKTVFLREIGLFSPHLHFAYSEDCDLSLRARELGHTIHQAQFRIVHHRAVTSKRVQGIDFIKERNHAYMRRRWAHYGKVRRMDYPIVVKRKGATGDVLLTTPIIRELAIRKPLCPIHVETDCVSIFRGNPNVANVSKRLLPIRDALVIDLNMAYEFRPNRHYVEGYAEVAELDSYMLKTELYPVQTEMEHARKLLGLGRWCAVHVGPTGWPGRDWPRERWQEVLDYLESEGWRTVLVGAPDWPLVAAMDLRGKTGSSIHALAAVLAACRMFVGIDSFPLHCAQAMRVPVVPLFGCSLPQFVLTSGSSAFPVVGDADCVGQRHREIGKTRVDCAGECCLSISVDRVIAAIEQASQTFQSPIIQAA